MFKYCWDRIAGNCGLRPWYMIIYALLQIVDALVIICTLGFWGTKFSMKYMFYAGLKGATARVAKEAKQTKA